MLEFSPTALRFMKASFNAATDGLAVDVQQPTVLLGIGQAVVERDQREAAIRGSQHDQHVRLSLIHI